MDLRWLVITTKVIFSRHFYDFRSRCRKPLCQIVYPNRTQTGMSSGMDPCVVSPGECQNCTLYDKCKRDQEPLCDGTANVVCHKSTHNPTSAPTDLPSEVPCATSQFVLLSLGFHKKYFIRSRLCRTILIRSALEYPELGASNGVSNLLIRLFGADLVTFEVAG